MKTTTTKKDYYLNDEFALSPEAIAHEEERKAVGAAKPKFTLAEYAELVETIVITPLATQHHLDDITAQAFATLCRGTALGKFWIRNYKKVLRGEEPLTAVILKHF